MLSIRPATVADLESVVALRLALLREEHDSPIYGRVRGDAVRRARQLYRAQLTSRTEVTLLADVDGATVGILRCVESTGSPLLEPDRYAYVSSVYVVPAARRTGIVRALLDRAGHWCRDRALAEMRLHSSAGSATANAAWDALGFTVVEHLRVRQVPAPTPKQSAAAHAMAPATAGRTAEPTAEPTASATASTAPTGAPRGRRADSPRGSSRPSADR